MARTKAIYGKKLLSMTYKTFAFEGIWQEVMGTPEKRGSCIIYGRCKHGKTWFSLLFAQYLSTFDTVLYVSAEQGYSKNFRDSYARAKIDPCNRKLKIEKRLTFEEISRLLTKRQSPKIVFIDNLSIYKSLKTKDITDFLDKHSDKYIVFIAHQTGQNPDGAVGLQAQKLADIIIKVEGLACEVSGRVPGGNLLIDEQKAMLYHGAKIKEKQP